MSTFNFTTARGAAALRAALLAMTLVAALPLASSSAEARIGGGFSFGSRGARTFSMPPATATAPRAAQPILRSETPSAGFGTTQPRRFGFGTGLAAGLLGAGLLGMLTGNGFFGGLGGVASLFGLLFQIALIGWLVWMAMRFFRRRAGPALVGAGPYGAAYSGLGGGLGSSLGARGTAQATAIGPQDFGAFERALSEIQAAYGREDLNAMARLATPEMMRNFAADIDQNRRRGLRNAVEDARLLQGDLAEAWREGASEYATVAMRFTTRDAMVERSSGHVVSGDLSRPSEATELWTFRRDAGGPWLLSAIQQAK